MSTDIRRAGAPDQGIGSAPTLKEGNPMIIYGGGGWKIWLAGLAVSLGIFAVLYFTVIKPTTDTANDAIKTSLKQSQQQLNEAKENAPSAQAKQQLSEAERLTACLQEAGIDTSAVQDCQAQFTP